MTPWTIAPLLPKPPNEWTQTEHNMCGRRAALPPFWWWSCLLKHCALILCAYLCFFKCLLLSVDMDTTRHEDQLWILLVCHLTFKLFGKQLIVVIQTRFLIFFSISVFSEQKKNIRFAIGKDINSSDVWPLLCCLDTRMLNLTPLLMCLFTSVLGETPQRQFVLLG